MGNGYKIYDQYTPHFITFSVVDWVDALTRKRYKDIIIDSLAFCQKEKQLSVIAYCLMANHVHLAVRAKGSIGLSAILRDFNKFTSNKILQSIQDKPESRRIWMLGHFAWRGKLNANNTHYQFWQQDNHPICLDSHKITQQKIEYIHQNPVKAGWVLNPEDYVYSSAAWYNHRSGPLEVDLYNEFG